MKLRAYLVLCLLALALPMTAGGQECPPLIDVPCFYNRMESSVWFGWHSQGSVSTLGQTITLECPARIVGLDLQFVGGTMVEGDTVQVAIMSVDGRYRYGQVVQTMPSWETRASFHCDLSGVSPMLAPGTYLIGATTHAPRYSALACCRIGDAYTGGQRMRSSGGLSGPWSADPDYDLRFHIDLEAPPIATAGVAWGSLHAWYR